MTLKLVASIALLLSVGAVACSGSPDPAGPSSSPEDPAPTSPPSSDPSTLSGNTGSVGLELTLPGGADVSVVSWTIAGPNGGATVVKSGSVDVHAGAAARVLISQLAPADGYTIVLSATSTDGGVSCQGSATFAITPRATTQVAVQLACSLATTGGHVTLVNGMSFDCAAWNTVTANPIETTVGHSVNLAATATGPVLGHLTYLWSAPTGQFGNATAASTSFTCTAPGPVMVTVAVGDGPVPQGSMCNSTLDTDTITVTCTGMAVQDAGTGDAGMADAGAGPPPPPPAHPVPAVPPWAALILALSTMGIGWWAAGRRQT